MSLLERLPEVSLKSDPGRADSHPTVARGGESGVREVAQRRNPELLAHVVNYCSERRRSGEWNTHTHNALSGRLYSFVASTGAQLTNIGPAQVRSWMSNPDLAPSTRALDLSAVRGFFQWAILEGLITRDPTVGLKRPRVPKALDRSLTVDQVADLISVLPDARARLIVSLMVNEALRRGEVARAHLHDVDLRSGVIEVRGKGHAGKVSRVVPLSVDTHHALSEYISSERGSVNGPLIQSRNNPHAGVSGPRITTMVREWMTTAGLKGRAFDGVSAHALRHTAAEDIYEHSGGNIRLVQQHLGHENAATTAVYMRRDVSGLAEVQATRPRYLSGSSAVGDEVTDGSAQQVGAVSELPESVVAVVTEQPPDDPGDVIVID